MVSHFLQPLERDRSIIRSPALEEVDESEDILRRFRLRYRRIGDLRCKLLSLVLLVDKVVMVNGSFNEGEQRDPALSRHQYLGLRYRDFRTCIRKEICGQRPECTL